MHTEKENMCMIQLYHTIYGCFEVLGLMCPFWWWHYVANWPLIFASWWAMLELQLIP